VRQQHVALVAGAQRVAPGGSVLGLDANEEVLAIARQKALSCGIANLELRVGDAADPASVPSGEFHAVTARWGLMYMSDPMAALANAHRALRPAGVMVAAVWAEPDRVPYHTLPRRLLEKYRPLSTMDPEAPGPFRLADTGRLAHDLAGIGFTLDHTEDIEVTVFECETDAEMVAWVRSVGVGRLLDGVPQADQRAWEQDLVRELRRTATDGLLRLGGVTRLVRARRD